MELTIEQALCVLKMGYNEKEEEELYSLAYDVIYKESRKLHLKYKESKAQKELKLIKMNKKDLEYIKETLEFVIEKCEASKDAYHEDYYNKTLNSLNIVNDELEGLKKNDPIIMLRRFKNHAEIHGYPTKSFKEKVKKFLKNN